MKFTFKALSRVASVKGFAAIALALTALVLPACGVGEEEGVYEDGEEEVLEEEGIGEEGIGEEGIGEEGIGEEEGLGEEGLGEEE